MNSLEDAARLGRTVATLSVVAMAVRNVIQSDLKGTLISVSWHCLKRYTRIRSSSPGIKLRNQSLNVFLFNTAAGKGTTRQNGYLGTTEV